MAEKSRNPDEELEMLGKSTINQNLDVYIWDMDETLILLNSLLKESYAEAFNGLKDVQKGVEIGRMWEKLILQLCDDCFFYEQVKFGYLVKIFVTCFCFWNVRNLIWIFFFPCRLKITMSLFLTL